MNKTYPQVRLGDVCEYYTGRIAAKLLDEKTYISTENMLSEKGGITVSSGLPTIAITPEYKKDNILLSNIRPYFKKIWFATQNGGCSNDVLVLKAKNNYFPKFLYYVLSDDKFFDYSTATSKGTKMPRGDKASIMQYSVPDIPNEEQRTIAATLSCLDDKIELNNKINANLEAQAQAIFKSWFVDFEPFQGGEFVESELGKIPKGWRVGKLREVAKMSAGGDKPKVFSKTQVEGCTIPIYSNGIDGEGLFGYTDTPKIFSESVTVSARGTIGYTCLRLHPYVPIVRLISLEPELKVMTSKYLYLWLLTSNINGTGTTQQQLTVPDFEKSGILIPPYEIIERFTYIVNSLFMKIDANKIENRTLAAIRDTLLPKLMSGDIEVEEGD